MNFTAQMKKSLMENFIFCAMFANQINNNVNIY